MELTESQLYDLKMRFSRIDRDGSGSVSAPELASMLGKSLDDLPAIRKLIEKYDLNSDASINFNEFVRMVAVEKLVFK